MAHLPVDVGCPAVLTGLPEPSCRIQVLATNREGILAEVVGEIQILELYIASVLSEPDRRSGNHTMFQLATTDPSSVMQSLKMARNEVSWVS